MPEIAVTKNVTEGLNIVANAIDWKAGDNVVVCAELEHPNNIYIWLSLRDRGVQVRAIPARNGAIDTQAMIDAIDARTRILTVASVTFAPGFRSELAALGRACRKSGALFLVDAVQSCGILDLDVEAAAIDALATSTSKGLMGIGGLGFLYVRSDWIGRLARLCRPLQRRARQGTRVGDRGGQLPVAARRAPLRGRQLQLARHRRRRCFARRAARNRDCADRSRTPSASQPSWRTGWRAGPGRHPTARGRRPQPHRDRRKARRR